jgi:hypothetical protein
VGSRPGVSGRNSHGRTEPRVYVLGLSTLQDLRGSTAPLHDYTLRLLVTRACLVNIS